MLSKKIRKNVITESIGVLFIKKGYKQKNIGGGDFSYVLDKGEYNINKIYFNFMDIGDIYASGLQISISEIENIIMEIGIPSYDLVDYISRKHFLTTIEDSFFLNSFKEKYRYYNFKTEAELQQFSSWLIDYMNTKGFAFVEHYSFLPNILAKMNQLMEDDKYWNGILSGLADYLFRGLIISKLCNDPDFDKKIIYCDKQLNSSESLSRWLPSYEKLKEKLNTLEPKYNATDGCVLNFEDIV